MYCYVRFLARSSDPLRSAPLDLTSVDPLRRKLPRAGIPEAPSGGLVGYTPLGGTGGKERSGAAGTGGKPGVSRGS